MARARQVLKVGRQRSLSAAPMISGSAASALCIRPWRAEDKERFDGPGIRGIDAR